MMRLCVWTVFVLISVADAAPRDGEGGQVRTTFSGPTDKQVVQNLVSAFQGKINPSIQVDCRAQSATSEVEIAMGFLNPRDNAWDNFSVKASFEKFEKDGRTAFKVILDCDGICPGGFFMNRPIPLAEFTPGDPSIRDEESEFRSKPSPVEECAAPSSTGSQESYESRKARQCLNLIRTAFWCCHDPKTFALRSQNCKVSADQQAQKAAEVSKSKARSFR